MTQLSNCVQKRAVVVHTSEAHPQQPPGLLEPPTQLICPQNYHDESTASCGVESRQARTRSYCYSCLYTLKTRPSQQLLSVLPDNFSLDS